jgi:hypothetical protein
LALKLRAKPSAMAAGAFPAVLPGRMILWGVVPATAVLADFRLSRRDEGAKGQRTVAGCKDLCGSVSWRLGIIVGSTLALILAFSPEEKESRWRVGWKSSRCHCKSHQMDFVFRARTFCRDAGDGSPSPWGEGRDEGGSNHKLPRPGRMILGGVVPATAVRADFRWYRRDEGAMGQGSVAVGNVLVGSASFQFINAGGTTNNRAFETVVASNFVLKRSRA